MLGNDCVWEGDRGCMESGEVAGTREAGEEELRGGTDRAVMNWIKAEGEGGCVLGHDVPLKDTTLFS